MPISALPPETVRLLGSPVVYTSPVSFVKELVDNAIDAGATCVEVLISPDTLDSVEVRDNGHGINPQDFSSIGRRGHTSKLRNFEDIQAVGPLTLGFRGDALACAAVLSTVTITTRTAKEPTASKLYLSAKGGVEKTERLAAPVGTAVKAVNIFSPFPVRKQFALKEAAKTITKIRELQHTYFFARPYLKLTVRILGHPKGVWSCIPGPHPSLREAAVQIFGADLVSQCVAKTYSTAAETTHAASPSAAGTIDLAKGNYVFEAFLPKPGADRVKISRWAFFSVDSRPMSFSKGTMKTVYSTFKARLVRNLEAHGIQGPLKQPFLALNIKCPPGTYDPNIEPSKDEVLFGSAQHLVAAFGRFLDEVYPPIRSTPDGANGEHGEPQASQLPSPPASDIRPQPSTWKRPQMDPTSPVPLRVVIEGKEALEKLKSNLPASVADQPKTANAAGSADVGRTRSNVDLLELGEKAVAMLERQKEAEASLVQSSALESQKTERSGQNISNYQGSGMMAPHLEPQPAFSVDMSEDAERIPKLRPPKPGPDVNPWAIAKRSSRSRHTQTEEQQLAPIAEPVHDGQSHAKFEEARRAMLARLANLLDADEQHESHQMRAPVPVPAIDSPRVPGGAFGSPMINNGPQSPAVASAPRRQTRNAGQLHRSLGAFMHDDEDYQASPSHRGRPSKRPRPDKDLVQATLDFGSRAYGKARRRDTTRDMDIEDDDMPLRCARPRDTHNEETDTGPDLAAIRRRQIMAENQRLRDQQEVVDHHLPQGQPPHHSLISPAASGPSSSRDIQQDKTTLAAGDPRAHLMKTGCSMPARTPRKLTRSKSSTWPLETIPAGFELRCLVQHMTIDTNNLIPYSEWIGDYGLHGSGLGTQDAFYENISKSDFDVLQQRITSILLQLGFDTTNGECKIEFISASRMLGKSAASI